MRPALAIVLVLVAVLAVACGTDAEEPATPEASPPASDADASGSGVAADDASGSGTKSAPAPLARNLEDANTLVGGGQEELDRRLGALSGYPVVVNRWASWCPPCREEFPFFEESAARHRSEIAFIGLNTQDDPAPAQEFLAEFPFLGPSLEDPDGALAEDLGIFAVSPSTVFIDAGGEVVFTRPGAYATAEELEADIRTYLPSG